VQETPKWISSLFLRAPESLRSVRRIPVLGEVVHRLSHRIVPADKKVWAQIESGPAKGLWLEVNPRTGQDYVRGEAEECVQDILNRNLRAGMVFYDLGANIGLFSLLAARLVGPGGKVFSFEPEKAVAERLRRNIARNEFSNVAVIEAGVWSSSCEKQFAPADSASPDHGTGTFVTGAARSGASIRCISLDDFARTAPPPDIIKCDVEGAEVEALRGAQDLIEKHRPRIVCEMHSTENEHDFRQILQQRDYDFFVVDDHHLFATPAGRPV